MRWFVLAIAAGFCAKGYTCCCQIDIFIPSNCECVQDNEDANNCERDHRSRAGIAEKILSGKPVDTWLHGLCHDVPNVTVAQLEAREQQERDWQAAFDKFCVKNE